MTLGIYNPEQEVDHKQEHETKIRKSLEKAGQKEELDENIYKILVMIEQDSKFNEDSRKIAIGSAKVLDYLEKKYHNTHSQFNFTEDEKREGCIAAVLHDIGKAGPGNATDEQRKAVIKLYAAEQITYRYKDKPISTAVAEKIESADEAEWILSHLEEIGINTTEKTMRDFWDMHAYWTKEVLEKYPANLTNRIRVIAASHHYDQGKNPYELKEADLPEQARVIEVLEDYLNSIREYILMAMDRYEANIRRSGNDHEKAMTWLRENLKEHIAKNPNLEKIIGAIEYLGRDGKIFEEEI